MGSLGIWLHQLWLLYLGYGVIGGCGLGLGYVSPVSTLIRWFPDRRGMAAGMAIMGFGGGAIIGAPLKEFLIHHFYQAPQYLGRVGQVTLTTTAGKRFASLAGKLREVVILGPNDVSQLLVPGPEGVYVLGTGRVGVAETFLVLGLLYLCVMVLAACSYRIPPEGWRPPGWNPLEKRRAERKMITVHNVHIDEALKTPQFYLLWIVLCFNVTAGIGVLGVAKTMMTEIFGTTLPKTVNAGFAANYVLMISLFNMAGRFFWASVSDYIGRKMTYTIFFILRDRVIPVDSLHRISGQHLTFDRLARLFLCRHHDHLHHVRWRVCHHSCLPGRSLRHPLCRRDSRAALDSLEHSRCFRSSGHHIAAGEFASASRWAVGQTNQPRGFRRALWSACRTTRNRWLLRKP